MARVALVTGGTRGIGRAISIALKRRGLRVAANYAGNDTAARQFQAETGIPIYKWDVSDYAACEKGVAAVTREVGPVDVLVNNAGITRDGMLHRMTKDSWDAVMRTNLDSVFNMTRLVIEGMRARSFGRIVSISSINGRKGQVGQANYSAAKAGLLGFSKAVAQEGAARGITCNVIAPGYIATEMVMAVPKDVLESKILPLIPVGRLGTAEEVARCVVFLAAEDAGFITGACLDANGGQIWHKRQTAAGLVVHGASPEAPPDSLSPSPSGPLWRAWRPRIARGRRGGAASPAQAAARGARQLVGALAALICGLAVPGCASGRRRGTTSGRRAPSGAGTAEPAAGRGRGRRRRRQARRADRRQARAGEPGVDQVELSGTEA